MTSTDNDSICTHGSAKASVQPNVCLLITKISSQPSARLISNPAITPEIASIIPSQAVVRAISCRPIPRARNVVNSPRRSIKTLANVRPRPITATKTPMTSNA